MPFLEENNVNRTYITFDTDNFGFKVKVGEGQYRRSGNISGYLKSVAWEESNHPQYPPKYLITLTDDEGNEGVLQTSEGGIPATAIINVLLGHPNPAGQWFRFGAYESSGGFLAVWIKDKPGGSEIPTLKGKYSKDQLDHWKNTKYNGDYAPLMRDLFEKELLPKFEESVADQTQNELVPGGPKSPDVIPGTNPKTTLETNPDRVVYGPNPDQARDNNKVASELAEKFDAVPAEENVNMDNYTDLDDDLPF